MTRKKTIQNNTYPLLTIGKVVDTNDPKQMGRVRVLCAALGDSGNGLLSNLPWATYVSPLAGTVDRGSRGRGDDTTTGPVAYGMWNIPKVGATALVACLDGDPRLRIYFGQLFGELLTHTLPHGRFSVQNTVADNSEETLTEVGFEDARPIGPFNSREEAIQPQYSTLQKTFTPSQDTVGAVPPTTPQRNYEYYTRGADKSVSRLTEEDVFDERVMSFSRDDLDDPFHIAKEGDVPNSTQGYQRSRIQPNATSELTGNVYDSQIYSWTTPGLHAIAMDDSPDNCRMRFRSTHGHQIILDDTNERIYVSVSGGKCWIELDEKGNIDFYASRNISFHAEKDFNITAKNIRMKADEGIHMIAEGEMRLHTKTDDLHIKSDQNIRMHSALETRLQSIGSLHLTSETVSLTANTQMDIKVTGGTLYVETSDNIETTAGTDIIVNAGANVDIKAVADATINAVNLDLKASGIGKFEATGNLELLSVGAAAILDGLTANVNAVSNVLLTGAQVHANGPPAATASPAGSAATATAATVAQVTEHKESWWTNRVPEHEPWPRVMTQVAVTDLDLGNTHLNSAEFQYDEDGVGAIERGEDLGRNPNWKR